MKILYYNWIQFDKKNNSGGGVNVYQKNLIDYLVKNTDNDIYFLSSGIYYNIFKKKNYIKKVKNIYNNRCKTFKLINSMCTAPAKTIAKDINTYLEDDSNYELLKGFIKEHGEFDVIHFNNIEGLSLKCLELKKDFPKTKFIFSIHNYFLFCPQINLFYNEECNCLDYENGKRCIECVKKFPTSKESKIFYKIDGFLEKIHLEILSDKIKIFLKTFKRKLSQNKVKENKGKIDTETYMQFRKKNVENINKYIDIILAVSDRVRQIAINMGIDENKIHTNYIGTKFADNGINQLNIKVDDEFINIGYLGYFEKMKGFDFLLESLEKIPLDIGKKINLYCYAKIKSDDDILKLERLNKLKDRLNSVYHVNGYTHGELPNILKNINIGIVPVIWEDNLPQIAIEYIAHGVPILTSNLGGAQELFRNEKFVFEAGNANDFIEKLTNIINNKECLKLFFENTNKLTSMEEHINILLKYYE